MAEDYSLFPKEAEMFGDTEKHTTPRSFQTPNYQNPKQPPSKPEKEKKSITTKTFAHGMMDVSLLTSNATHLRTVLSDSEHDFYWLLIVLITASITLQVISGVLLIMADYFKTQVKEKDRQTQGRRKLLNFVSLAMVMIVTSLNILISVFSSSGSSRVLVKSVKNEMPEFVSESFKYSQSHNEL